MDTCLIDQLDDLESGKKDLYQSFDIQEEIRRVSHHYEMPPRFFDIITGGLWNTYSCNLWDDASTLTQAQERKLDEFARLANIKPGQRILDVGCGWGGPLVYLCQKYNAEGHGITIAPAAIPIAQRRSRKYKTKATFSETHWKNLPEREEYDIIITDEAIVHFNDLEGFFKKCNTLLKPNGVLINKELHFKHSMHAHANDKLSQHINKIYGYSGNYRTLSEELFLLDSAGFALSEIVDINIEHYIKTIGEYWLKNLIDNKSELEQLTSKKYVHDVHIYMKGILKIFRMDIFRIHMVSAKPIKTPF